MHSFGPMPVTGPGAIQDIGPHGPMGQMEPHGLKYIPPGNTGY